MPVDTDGVPMNTTAMVLASVEVVSVLVDEEVTERNVSSENPDDPFLAPAGSYLVTLAVTPDELTRLVYIKEHARLLLAGAADTVPTGETYPQNIDTVLNAPSFEPGDAPSSLAFNEGALNDALPVPGSALDQDDGAAAGSGGIADEPDGEDE